MPSNYMAREQYDHHNKPKASKPKGKRNRCKLRELPFTSIPRRELPDET